MRILLCLLFYEPENFDVLQLGRVLERILGPPLRRVHEMEPQPRRFNCE